MILVYGNGYLHAVSCIDGDILWKKDLAQKGFGNFTRLVYCSFDSRFMKKVI